MYMRLFCQLAHANGYQVVTAPARDLGNVTTSVKPKLSGETLDKWYMRTNVAGAAAAYADLYIIQSQVDTASLASYGSLVTTAKAQALAANPWVRVNAELSTNYGTVDQMVTAAKSIVADGFYVSATVATIPQLDAFLLEM